MSDEFEVAIVGGGIAGMSAALTSARLGRHTAILAGGLPGGQLVSINVIEGVPGFPDGVPGYDLCPMAQEQADAAGAKFVTAECESIALDGERWRITSSGGDIASRAVIVATGTALAKLGVPGEERLSGKGVSECASCDAPLLRGKIAVVVGGGDSAMQEALTLIEHVAKVVILERGDALTGQASYRNRVIGNPKIEIRYGTVVTEIVGDNAVSHVRIKDIGDGAEMDLETAGIFACTGLVPNTKLVRDRVSFDRTGRIQVDVEMRTRAQGLCAAGNVRARSPHRAAGAMGDGAAAAIAIDRYLATGEWRDLG